MSLGLLRYFLHDFSHTWFAPADEVARAARALGLLLLLLAFMPRVWLRALLLIKRRTFVAAVALLAALGSIGYWYWYLRGGPRIVDGATYYLQARSLSQGHFTWPLETPSANFRGRFLFTHGDRIGGIFPPGYPLLLALGFLVGSPMVIGPLLGAALIVLVYALALEVARSFPSKTREAIARSAALFSLFSFTQRYHTADTMSHGAVALAVGLALLYALLAARKQKVQLFLVAGLCIGYVASARMVSALPIGLVVSCIALASRIRIKAVALLALGVVPGMLLLLLSQYAVTGHAFESTQLAYYARSDGPPGCFRYGFGPHIGCVYEHGEFVRNRLQNGHTLSAAIETTVWRLKLHMLDPLNVELLLVVLVPLAVARGLFHRAARFCLLLLMLQYGAYVPFYFDGVYPGGGARFFADVLPIEHVLLSLPFAFRKSPTLTMRTGLVMLGCALVGFAYRGSKDHALLRGRDGGRPAFEPRLLSEAHIDRGLLFVESDAAFGLAYQPGMTPDRGVVVAHYRGGAHDYELWRRLGSPPSYFYAFGEKASSVSPYMPKPSHRLEAEREWPPLSQTGGFVMPGGPWCASEHGALHLLPHLDGQASASVDVPVSHAGDYRITPHVVALGLRAAGTLTLRSSLGDILARWSWNDGDEERCLSLNPIVVSFDERSHSLEFSSHGREVALDALDVEPLP